MKNFSVITCLILVTLLIIQPTTSFIRHGRNEIPERFRSVQELRLDKDQAVTDGKYIFKLIVHIYRRTLSQRFLSR